MDLRQLEVFRQVVDSGSVSEAARRLHMSQPPVTYAVRQLEQELGAPLFERSAPLEDFACRPLCTEPMIAVAPPDAPLGGERLSLQSLEGRPLILYRRYEELIRSAFARQGLSPELLCVCDDARDALLWVRAGLATALFPRSMRSLCAGLPLAELSEPELTTRALLVWRRGAPPAPAVRDFLALCPPEKPE